MRAQPPAEAGSRLWFPDPRQALREGPWNGLLAVGGDLSCERLLLAYRMGIFPWTGLPLTWWSPDPRAVIEFAEFHVPRSLARLLRRGDYSITFDRAFREVMAACAAPAPGRERTWISPGFIEAYTALHRAGYAHSLECWRQGVLIGGIYGVAIGGFFAGESMFHLQSNASKIALAHLVKHLQLRHYALFDIQMVTPVTRQLGAREIPREDYLRRLSVALDLPRTFQEVDPTEGKCGGGLSSGGAESAAGTSGTVAFQ